MGTLTVKENLMFSANLRLPPSTTTEERARRVDETIAELGLTECQNSKVSFSLSLTLLLPTLGLTECQNSKVSPSPSQSFRSSFSPSNSLYILSLASLPPQRRRNMPGG